MGKRLVYKVAHEAVEIIKRDRIIPSPCNYKKIFIVEAKFFNMSPIEILTYLCDPKDTINTEEEIRSLSEEVFKALNKVENTVDFLNENVSDLVQNYEDVDLESQNQEDLGLYLAKLKQENLNMHQKLQSVAIDIKEQKTTISQLYSLVNKDILMNIYSRRYMEDKLKNLIYEYKRYNIPFSILMIDIDDFKVINDNYGHRVGDTVRMRVGELLKNSLRQSDIPTRYGGDEVLVLLPNTTLIFAQKAALKIQNLFKNIRFRTQGKEFMITISIGVYEVQPQDDAESMLNKSDIALYKAKQDGKDRVVIYSGSEDFPVRN